MQKTVYIQLSALTFFQYFVAGATSPLLGTYLKDTLGFTGAEVGLILMVFQAASMVAPLAVTLVVDRLIPARNLYAGLHFTSAAVSFSLLFVHSFVPVLGLFSLYALFLGPTGALVNAMVFARMPDGKKQFGPIRLWGTVGWILAAFVLSLLWFLPGASMVWMFIVSGLGSLAAAAGTLSLPRVPPASPQGPFRLIPKAALRVFLRPGILKVGILFFLMAILDRCAQVATAPFLKQLGFSDSQLVSAMTLCQMTEVGFLLLLGPILKRWGLGPVLLLGIGGQMARFALMAWNPGAWALLGAQAVSGSVFAFFYAGATVYVDGHTDEATRGGVHQLLSLVFIGTASLVGSLVSGLAFDWFGQAGLVDYRVFWLLPLGLSAVTLALVPLFFSREGRTPRPSP